jgi:hypothetical protein
MSASTSGYAPNFRRAYPHVLDLLGRLYDIIASSNSALFKSVLKAAASPTSSVLQRLDLAAVGAVDWEHAFQPLHASVVYSIARVVLASASGPSDESEDVHAMLDFLHNDVGLIVVHRLGSERSSFCVYPSSALAVLLHLDWLLQQKFTTTDWALAADHSGRNAGHWLLQQSVVSDNWRAAASELSSLVKVAVGSAARVLLPRA